MKSNMALQEAIDHLKDTLSDKDHKWNCEECKNEHEQLLKWLLELQRYRTIANEIANLLREE